MAHATGYRIASALCFLIGGVSLIGIPVLWPVGYWLYKKADEKEAEREAELDAITS